MKKYFILLCFSTIFLTSEASVKKLPPYGISPLFSLSHTIMPEKMFAVAETFAYLKQKKGPTYITSSEAFYGLTPYATLIASLPIISLKSENPASPVREHNKGVGNLFLHSNFLIQKDQSEYHRHRLITSIGIRPPTSALVEKTFYTLDTSSLFFGIAQDALTPLWYIYYDSGVFLPIKKKNLQYGNLFLTNIGLGRTFHKNSTFITLFAEVSNAYSRPTRINNQIIPTTGSNELYLGSSLRIHTKRMLIQGGFQQLISESYRIRSNRTTDFIGAFFVAYSF